MANGLEGKGLGRTFMRAFKALLVVSHQTNSTNAGSQQLPHRRGGKKGGVSQPSAVRNGDPLRSSRQGLEAWKGVSWLAVALTKESTLDSAS